MMKVIWKYFNLITIIFVSCAGQPESEGTIQQTAEPAVASFERTPNRVVSNNGIEVGVYDFNNLQPFFEQDDDRVHVINFWATWCVPCVQELPAFYELHDKYSPEVEVILVSLDFKSKIESDLIPFIAENKIKAEVVLLDEPDGNNWIPKIDKDWSGSIPATVIYRGDEWTFYERSFNFEELEAETKPLINKK
jgi:thiol-disulfide isomerase/thioredoxin